MMLFWCKGVDENFVIFLLARHVAPEVVINRYEHSNRWIRLLKNSMTTYHLPSPFFLSFFFFLFFVYFSQENLSCIHYIYSPSHIGVSLTNVESTCKSHIVSQRSSLDLHIKEISFHYTFYQLTYLIFFSMNHVIKKYA